MRSPFEVLGEVLGAIVVLSCLSCGSEGEHQGERCCPRKDGGPGAAGEAGVVTEGGLGGGGGSGGRLGLPDAGADGAGGAMAPDASAGGAPTTDAESPVCEASVGLSPRRLWQSTDFTGCALATLLRYDAADGPKVIVSSGEGNITALDPATGEQAWRVALPARGEETAYVIATPVIVDERLLVVTWQDLATTAADPAADERSSHRVAVVDLEAGELDPSFPVLELAARKPNFEGTADVVFTPGNALSRSTLVHAPLPGGALGGVYVSFGNARDIQPWHGWMFELDLDAWKASGVGAAVRSVLLTTPESDCGTPGVSGSRDMICGGGIWAPAGPILLPTDDGSFDLLVPTGNGALELPRHDYAHTVMRIHGPGLAFDDGCDPVLCADWNVLAPSEACMSSCRNLFIPRLTEGEPPFDVPACAGKTFFECYAALDWDLGADSPAVVDIPGGPRALLLPAKDGGVYLFDAGHLGTLYDRIQIVEPCGKGGAACGADWAGMMVTRPEITTVGGAPLGVIATFNTDRVHAAGLVGVRITMEGGAPTLTRAWTAPSFETEEAVQNFRRHPSRVRLVDLGGATHAVVVDQGLGTSSAGDLYVVRVSDGEVVAREKLDGPGQRFAQPLAIGGDVFMASCWDGNRGPSHIEAWRFAPPVCD